MPNNPVGELIGELGKQLTRKKHSDIVLIGKNKYPIEPKEFQEIRNVSNPKKIAFVDGGNGPLLESPNFLISVNRIYFSIFQGKIRIKSSIKSRIEFFSYVISNIHSKNKSEKVRFDTKLFTYSDKDREFLPLELDLTSSMNNSTILQETRLNSLARRFAEWNMAIKVVNNELDKGDMIVMDGSLQTGFENEIKYAKKLYKTAQAKGVIVCGLTKTSRLITESGDPLLARIAEISEKVNYTKWFVKVAEEVSSDDEGFMLAAKFHANSNFVFRFEILREQFKKMNKDQINLVLSSLAANSQDIAMLGYPYGAIDADRFAQVRINEIPMYKGIVISEMAHRPEWKKLQKYSQLITVHDILNKVTS